MLLWPIVCVAVWSAEQFRLQCSLECPQRRQRRDRRLQRIPNLCRGDGEGAIADGPVQRPWNMQRRWRCRSQTSTWVSSEQQGRRATCRRHRRWTVVLPAGSSRCHSKPPTPPRDRSAPLRFTDAAASLRVTAFSFMLVPFCRYSFSLLCPSPPSFSTYL